MSLFFQYNHLCIHWRIINFDSFKMHGKNVKTNISCYDISLAQGHATVLKTKININYVDKSVHPSKRTDCFSITKTKGLIMFREVIAVYCKSHTKSIFCLYKVKVKQSL